VLAGESSVDRPSVSRGICSAAAKEIKPECLVEGVKESTRKKLVDNADQSLVTTVGENPEVFEGFAEFRPLSAASSTGTTAVLGRGPRYQNDQGEPGCIRHINYFLKALGPGTSSSGDQVGVVAEETGDAAAVVTPLAPSAVFTTLLHTSALLQL
jgi:hypothetical protein